MIALSMAFHESAAGVFFGDSPTLILPRLCSRTRLFGALQVRSWSDIEISWSVALLKRPTGVLPSFWTLLLVCSNI